MTISEIKQLFLTRLDILDHILSVGEQHFTDMDHVMRERLADDMLPLGAQVALACNQPRGFSQWCAGQPVENLDTDVSSLAQARDYIRQTREQVEAIDATDRQLDEIKRLGLGPGRFCELPAQQYLHDFLIPNLYFHITTSYAILRKLGVPLSKTDFLRYLMPHVREDAS
ncbi:MAG: DUF1993 domain-containing protein [Alcanivorax sp.]|nr:DUF1993 domain-containing protein [Alcanivorax sp.]